MQTIPIAPQQQLLVCTIYIWPKAFNLCVHHVLIYIVRKFMKLIRTTLQLSTLLLSLQATYISGSASAREKQIFILLKKKADGQYAMQPEAYASYGYENESPTEGADYAPNDVVARQGWTVVGMWPQQLELEDLYSDCFPDSIEFFEQQQELAKALYCAITATASERDPNAQQKLAEEATERALSLQYTVDTDQLATSIETFEKRLAIEQQRLNRLQHLRNVLHQKKDALSRARELLHPITTDDHKRNS